jgi:hypothetical protein
MIGQARIALQLDQNAPLMGVESDGIGLLRSGHFEKSFRLISEFRVVLPILTTSPARKKAFFNRNGIS